MSLASFALNVRYSLNWRKPRLIQRLVGAVVRSHCQRTPRLRYVDFAIDFGCNLRCDHCFASTLVHPGRPKMQVDDYRRVACEAMAMGALNFSFQGGEPLLFDGLGDIIHACQPDRNVISVTTNGTLLTRERAKELRRWGVDILTISIDSSLEEEHDKFRGMEGALARSLEGLRHARAEGLNVTIGSVVTHQNLHSEGIQGIIDMATREKLLMYFIMPVPAGRWKDNADMMLTDEDQQTIAEWTQKSPYLRTDFQANLSGVGCGAVKEILYLTPYGDVLACPFMHIALGNVRDTPLSAIRARAMKNPWFAEYHPRCLVSTDTPFIEKHLSKTFDAPSLPIPYEDAFPEEASRQEGNS